MSTRGFLIGILFHRYNAERTEVISGFHSLLLLRDYENTWSDRLLFPNTLPNFLYDLIVTGFHPSTFVTALFPLRFCFFTVFLAQWLCGVAPWWAMKGKILNFSSQIAEKIIFLGFFLEFFSFMGSFDEKLTKKICTTFLFPCL